MERYTMFRDWKNQYCQNDCIVQPKAMQRFNAVSIKLKLAFSTELEQKI